MDTLERLFSFSGELQARMGYEEFCQASANTAKLQFPIKEGMPDDQIRLMLGNRIKVNMQEDRIKHEYGIQLMKEITSADENSIKEQICF